MARLPIIARLSILAFAIAATSEAICDENDLMTGLISKVIDAKLPYNEYRRLFDAAGKDGYLAGS